MICNACSAKGAQRDKAKCKLRSFMSESLSLEAHEEDNKTVGMGFKVIFPCLKAAGYGGCDELRSKLAD